MTAKKVKSIVKTNVADKATFGTNPKDPWSTKAELGESAGLDKYLLSRGINPKFVSKDIKVAHSKSNQFKQWARNHAMIEDTVTPSPTMDRLRQIKKKEREGKVIHHQESTLGPRADKLLARSDSAFKAGDKETSSRAHKLFMRAKEKHLSNPDNAEKHRAHIMGGAGDYYKSKKPGQYVGDSVELEGNIVSETNVCKECNEDPCACSHGFVEGNLAEGSYDDDKGITHTRGSLVAKLEALPKGSDDFEWNRIQATHHLKQGNMLRAKYHMALMKRGEKVVAEGFQPVVPVKSRSQGSVSPEQQKDIDRDVKLLNKYRSKGMSAGSAADRLAKFKHKHMDEQGVAEGLPQTLRKVVPGYAKREIDKKMDAGKFGKTDADKDANFQRYKKIQDKIKEQVVAEVSSNTLKSYQQKVSNDSMKHKMDPTKRSPEKANRSVGGFAKAQNRLEKGVSEAKESDYGGDYQSAVHAVKTKAEKKPVDMKSLAARMQASYRRDNEKSKVKAIPAMKENMMDPSAPSQAPVDGANSSNDCEPQPTKQPQISKAAKLIKSLKKTKVVKEELYDHEKEDKSVKSNKKTTFQKPGEDSVTKEQPQAAAVLSGGKTMTGTPRDVVEIDPMMKMRKQVPDGQKQNEKPQKNG